MTQTSQFLTSILIGLKTNTRHFRDLTVEQRREVVFPANVSKFRVVDEMILYE